MIEIKNFGKRLEECMENAGYTNTRLTKELGISKNAIGNYKNDQIPNAVILHKLSQILGTTMEYLLSGTKNNYLTIEEQKLIDAYRNADPAIQTATKKILDINDEREISSVSKTG